MPTAGAPSMPAADGDPLEPLNRKVLAFNYVVDRALLKPAAAVYVRVLPGFARKGVRNVLDNLNEPRTVLNQCLQGKVGLGVSDAARFLVNTTVGLGGLFDPATAMGLERHEEDFGQTLGRWGVRRGPYLMVPILGPTTLRDGAAKAMDIGTGPMAAVDNDNARYAIGVVRRIDTRSGQLTASTELGDDPYVFLRDAYLKRRAAEVADE